MTMRPNRWTGRVTRGARVSSGCVAHRRHGSPLPSRTPPRAGTRRPARRPPALPSRASGVVRRRRSPSSGFQPSGSMTTPGATAFTRTSGARACASARVICTTAAFVMPCGTYAGHVSNAARSAMFTIDPCARAQCGRGALREKERRAHVDREHGVPLGDADLSDRRAQHDRRGVHERIERTVLARGHARSVRRDAPGSARSACTAIAWPPPCSIMRAVSSAPSREPL